MKKRGNDACQNCRRCLGWLLLFSILGGCSLEPDFLPYEPQIVVEGWIENESGATVILSQSLPPNLEMDSTELTNIPIRWAKVVISNGTEEEVLVGQKDNRCLVGYSYVTTRMKGEVGRTYTLRVEYAGRQLTAQTTIPSPVELSALEIKSVEGRPNQCYLSAKLNDPLDQQNYYLLRVNEEVDESAFFRLSYLGAWSDEVIEPQKSEVPIFRPFVLNLGAKNDLYFNRGGTILVRVSQVDPEAYRFWSDYQKMVINMGNLVFPFTKSLRGNVEGGLGVWYGCGSVTYSLSLAPLPE